MWRRFRRVTSTPSIADLIGGRAFRGACAHGNITFQLISGIIAATRHATRPPMPTAHNAVKTIFALPRNVAIDSANNTPPSRQQRVAGYIAPGRSDLSKCDFLRREKPAVNVRRAGRVAMRKCARDTFYNAIFAKCCKLIVATSRHHQTQRDRATCLLWLLGVVVSREIIHLAFVNLNCLICCMAFVNMFVLACT